MGYYPIFLNLLGNSWLFFMSFYISNKTQDIAFNCNAILYSGHLLTLILNLFSNVM